MAALDEEGVRGTPGSPSARLYGEWEVLMREKGKRDPEGEGPLSPLTGSWPRWGPARGPAGSLCVRALLAWTWLFYCLQAVLALRCYVHGTRRRLTAGAPPFRQGKLRPAHPHPSAGQTRGAHQNQGCRGSGGVSKTSFGRPSPLLRPELHSDRVVAWPAGPDPLPRPTPGSTLTISAHCSPKRPQAGSWPCDPSPWPPTAAASPSARHLPPPPRTF